MNGSEYIRLGLRILDEQLVDAEGRRCGRVEDLEFDAAPPQTGLVRSIICGATAWKRRLPSSIADLFPGDPSGLRRVPWDQVHEIGNEILLRAPEDELPHASQAEPGPMALSLLIGRRFAGEAAGLGRVQDVVARRPEDSEANAPWELYGLLVGRAGMLQRIGFSPMLDRDLAEDRPPDNLVLYKSVSGFDEQGRLLIGMRPASQPA